MSVEADEAQAPQPPTLHQLVAAMRRNTITAQLWLALLNQDRYWVPQGAWDAYGAASIGIWAERQTLGPHPTTGEQVLVGEPRIMSVVTPDFTVAGVLEVAGMDASYKATVRDFLWRKTVAICEGMSWQSVAIGEPRGEQAADALEAEERYWERLAHDHTARRAWFNNLPLPTALLQR